VHADLEATGAEIEAKILTCALTAGVILGSSGAMTSIAGEKEQLTNRIGGPLDGRSFVGALGPRGKPKDIEDRFVFVNGTFASKECELKCKYPARPYFIRKVGDKIEFISETNPDHAPHDAFFAGHAS
jgi:hypothetical protein